MKKVVLFFVVILVFKVSIFAQGLDTLTHPFQENPITINDYFVSEDKFTHEKMYTSYSPDGYISINKFILNKSYKQYIEILIPGSTLNYECYGVSILFDNGKMISRPKEKVETSYGNNGWEYKAWFSPTVNEINLLKSYKVEAVKLYVYDKDINYGDTFLTAAKVMLSTPPIKKITKK